MSLLIVSCGHHNITGYVVCKQYIKAHWDNETADIIYESSVIDIIIPVHTRHNPQWINSQFIIYLGNINGVRGFKVDSLFYTDVRCGQKLTLNTVQLN